MSTSGIGKTADMYHPPAAMKPNRKDVGYYMRLSAEDKAFLLKMGGVRWIRLCIELAREREMK